MMASHLRPWTMLQSLHGWCHPWVETAQCVIKVVAAFMGSAAYHVMRGVGARRHWGRCITDKIIIYVCSIIF